MKLFFQKLFGLKTEVNYLYFTFFLFFLSLLSLTLSQEKSLPVFPLFFLLYAIGQAFLEVCFFILITYLLKRWAPNWVFLLFISASFLLLLLHYTHFLMVRVMDASLLYLLKFFFGSGFDHLIAGFQALNLNGTLIAIAVSLFLLLPLLGLGFYWLTSYASQRKPLYLNLFQIILALGTVGMSLFFLDLVAHPFLGRHIYSQYKKILPLGTTFITPTLKQMALSEPLPPPRQEEKISLPSLTLSHRPNIYLFVIETLRRDFIQLETAPHLTAFAQENISFPSSFANANSTHLSWFAIFHSDLPFYWAQMRDSWKKGSVPLRYLKELGYQIHVYSSADLRYFNMDQLLFGEGRNLADTIEEYTEDRNLAPCDRDALAIEALKRQLAPEGQVHLIFLDSTHSEYSFPKDFPLLFAPISKEIDYLTIGPKSGELESIKNRYRNAIFYVDQLIGKFFDYLKTKNLWNDAIIALTGDHGEEFFEEGALFHGTHLNRYQTSVPLFFRFPSSDWRPQTKVATHLDIFPSILHYLTQESDFSSLFDGQSIFRLNRWPYQLAVLQDGADIPTEFTLENGPHYLHGRFVDPSHIEVIDLQGTISPHPFPSPQQPSPVLKN